MYNIAQEFEDVDKRRDGVRQIVQEAIEITSGALQFRELREEDLVLSIDRK